MGVRILHQYLEDSQTSVGIGVLVVAVTFEHWRSISLKINLIFSSATYLPSRVLYMKSARFHLAINFHTDMMGRLSSTDRIDDSPPKPANNRSSHTVRPNGSESRTTLGNSPEVVGGGKTEHLTATLTNQRCWFQYNLRITYFKPRNTQRTRHSFWVWTCLPPIANLHTSATVTVTTSKQALEPAHNCAFSSKFSLL